MDITFTTPALLFPTISLLLLAYTNRFLAIATLIRGLHTKYLESPNHVIKSQIVNLRQRVVLIKQMQFTGILSLLLCMICMFAIYYGYFLVGKVIFAASLIVMMLSLILTLREIQISVTALNLELSDLEEMNES